MLTRPQSPKTKVTQLYDKVEAATFYEQRYNRGYMDKWPTFKKERVFKLIRELGLPATGRALDIGCGNGVFTDVIKQALPKWEVYGAEISETAVRNAIERYPDCNFLVASDEALKSLQFDFVFSHHVLEHVYNVREFLGEINGQLQPRSAMLHICPCGNAGSLEDEISKLIKNGIESDHENRCFFEEPGHLRRLTTEDLIDAVKDFDFRLASEWYSHHYWSSVNSITTWQRAEVKKLTNFQDAINKPAHKRLKKLRRYLLLLTYLRLPLNTFNILKHKPAKSIKEWLKLTGATTLFPFAKPVDMFMYRKALKEWDKKKLNKNGSEMYLFFTRDQSIGSLND